MTDLTQLIRWKTKFVRGLAQSVLERAREIRSSLGPADAPAAAAAPTKKAKPKRKAAGAAAPRARKKTAKKAKRPRG